MKLNELVIACRILGVIFVVGPGKAVTPSRTRKIVLQLSWQTSDLEFRLFAPDS